MHPRCVRAGPQPLACVSWLWVDAGTLRACVAWMLHFAFALMRSNKKACPVEARRLRAEAIVKVSNSFPQMVQKPCGAQNRRAGFQVNESPRLQANFRRKS
jgi:hypothetical protein